MPNHFLTDRTALEIDQQVEKILADLDNPSPPLDLGEVRELLKLDRRYYSSTDTSIVQEVIHSLRIGATQVLLKPTRILQAIKQRKLRALWVPERKRILLDESLPEIKLRWGEGHEIIHSVIPHHKVLNLGDPEHTLVPSCLEQIEAEANYGAGRLLFLRNEFKERLLSKPVTFAEIQALAKVFANSKTSALWRAVETLDVPAIGLVSIHPWSSPGEDGETVRHFIRSKRFAKQFSSITDAALFKCIAKVVRRTGGGPLGSKEVELLDVDGDTHVFCFECFSNTHDTLTLGLHVRKKPALVAV